MNHLCDVISQRPLRCTQIKTYSWDTAQVVLVGNKCDMVRFFKTGADPIKLIFVANEEFIRFLLLS